MGGLVAGCAIAEYSVPSDRVRLVALTVNNKCNLSCPHCYLQYAKPSEFFDKARADRLVSQDFEHLAIVGMEPFLNPDTARRTSLLARKAVATGKTVSAITNGVGLNHLATDEARLFSYLDISFDGGPATYQQFRGASYTRLTRNLLDIHRHGVKLNGIHVVFRQNMGHLDDMLAILDELPINRLMFAPFMPAQTDGHIEAGKLPVLELLPILAKNRRFRSAPNAFLLLDQYHLDGENIGWAPIHASIERLGLSDKVHMVPLTPLRVGSLRVTYDGLVLSPKDALHPTHYAECGLSFDDISLQAAYDQFCCRERTERERSVAAE